ncbi:TPA: hypothetical protein ACH3X1_012905 [Trebouxia sp. C0004]
MVLEASLQTMVRWLAFCRRHHMELCGQFWLQKLRTQDFCILMVGMVIASNRAGHQMAMHAMATINGSVCTILCSNSSRRNQAQQPQVKNEVDRDDATNARFSMSSSKPHMQIYIKVVLAGYL